MTQAAEELENEELDSDEFEEDGPPPREIVLMEAPEEFESVGANILGYYEPTESGAIQFVITGVRLLDNTQDKSKSSALILAELHAPAHLRVNSPVKTEQVLKEFPKGTGFGIWAKAGMRDLQNLQGAIVWMSIAGYQKMKDDGKKKNAMVLFSIKKSNKGGAGGPLKLLEDARVESREEPAREKNPPWHLIVLGADFGRKEAAIIMQRRLAQITNN
jgi:hypothetical protein